MVLLTTGTLDEMPRLGLTLSGHLNVHIKAKDRYRLATYLSGGNAIAFVRSSVRPSVSTLTFELRDLLTLIF